MKYRTGKLIYNTTVVVLIICGIIWVSSRFVHLGRVEYTDNAQVKQLIVPVNSRVQGFVQRICFDEYQTVHKGDTLALIEDTEFRYRLAQAEAEAIERVATAIRSGSADPSTYLLAVKYIEALKEMAGGDHDKTIYIPYEATSVIGALGGIRDLFEKGPK